jgi:hypothetical protein
MLQEQLHTIYIKSQYSRTNARSASKYTMFAPTQLLRNWSQQRPSNQVVHDSSVVWEARRVYYTTVHLLVISFLCSTKKLLLGCFLNDATCM